MTHRYGSRAWMVTALVLACAACGASGGAVTTTVTATPVTATPVTSALHIDLTDINVADGKSTAKADSPQVGSGSLTSAIKVDFSDPGPNNDCNTVDETATFTFPAGTITYRSWHRDCNFGGPRIQTIFAITGGTGRYAGATGWGTEQDVGDGIAFDGTITYAAATQAGTK